MSALETALAGTTGLLAGWLLCGWAAVRNRERTETLIERKLDDRVAEHERARGRAMSDVEPDAQEARR